MPGLSPKSGLWARAVDPPGDLEIVLRQELSLQCLAARYVFLAAVAPGAGHRQPPGAPPPAAARALPRGGPAWGRHAAAP
ncbi:hypothetical protein HaLaN_29220 [Haematococcus lacustris]|uniref:Uncharacterized protein n=1 Tax=Haematococcus lacustris TaxID=44745 RepID=A0A6A0ACA8_HAELA|nr:hypothetical protein HaLaN_29220 [Haematococcus lacustris]